MLQLAALSLKNRDDPGAFIAGFAGDDRFVVDYLADEVLNRQPKDIRSFLLEKSKEESIWPDDRLLRTSWLERTAGQNLRRDRIELIFKAIERAQRSTKAETLTLKLVKEFCAGKVGEVRCAVLYEKPRSVVNCEYVWRRTDRWIDFPWSADEPVGAAC